MEGKTGKLLHVAGSGKRRLNSPVKGGGAMAGIFTFMAGNWELLGNELKDRKISPRGWKWKGKD
jgi:hypothetical protein